MGRRVGTRVVEVRPRSVWTRVWWTGDGRPARSVSTWRVPMTRRPMVVCHMVACLAKLWAMQGMWFISRSQFTRCDDAGCVKRPAVILQTVRDAWSRSGPARRGVEWLTTPRPSHSTFGVRPLVFFMDQEGHPHVRRCFRGGGNPAGTWCDNTLSAPHPVGGRASQTVSPGSPVGEYPPRKKTPKSTHARRRPGEGAPATNTSCVTGSLLARVEGLEATLTSHPLIPSVPLGPSENPPQRP